MLALSYWLRCRSSVKLLNLLSNQQCQVSVAAGDAAWTILPCLPRHSDRAEVFWNPAARRQIDIDCLWRDVRREAGLHGVRLHDLRHSFASHAAVRSETLPIIGKLLGHRYVTATARYAHLDGGPVIEAGSGLAT